MIDCWTPWIPLPFGFSPTAMHRLAHADGELATSRAAAKRGLPMGLSTYSTVSLEEVRRQGHANIYAFQLSIVKDRQVSLNWVRRAEGQYNRVSIGDVRCMSLVPSSSRVSDLVVSQKLDTMLFSSQSTHQSSDEDSMRGMASNLNFQPTCPFQTWTARPEKLCLSL